MLSTEKFYLCLLMGMCHLILLNLQLIPLAAAAAGELLPGLCCNYKGTKWSRHTNMIDKALCKSTVKFNGLEKKKCFLLVHGKVSCKTDVTWQEPTKIKQAAGKNKVGSFPGGSFQQGGRWWPVQGHPLIWHWLWNGQKGPDVRMWGWLIWSETMWK